MMAAGDIVQSQSISTGGTTATTIIVTLPVAVSSGNTVVIALSASGEPTSVPSGFTLVDDPNGNVVYSGQPAGESSWTFGFAATGPIAGFATEHVGIATFSGADYTVASAAGTSSTGPSIASTSGDVLLDYCFAGNQPTTGLVTGWSNGYTAVGQSSTSVTGGFNLDVAMATQTSSGTASSTTATFDAASWWTNFQVAATFSGGSSGGDTPKPVVFRIDAGGVLVPVDVSSL